MTRRPSGWHGQADSRAGHRRDTVPRHRQLRSGHGYIEIGEQEMFGFIVRAIGDGGMTSKTTDPIHWPRPWRCWRRACEVVQGRGDRSGLMADASAGQPIPATIEFKPIAPDKNASVWWHGEVSGLLLRLNRVEGFLERTQSRSGFHRPTGIQQQSDQPQPHPGGLEPFSSGRELARLARRVRAWFGILSTDESDVKVRCARRRADASSMR